MKAICYLLGFMLIPLMCLLACNSKSPVHKAGGISTLKTAVSDCSGFTGSANRSSGDIPFTLDPKTYEDSERLLWQYDEKTAVLSVMNARVILNCCGERSVSASQDEDDIIIAEKDKPEDGTNRCRCICPFDFFIKLSGISPQVVPLKLTLTVDDSTWTKWQGDIDIAGESGEVIISGTNNVAKRYRR